jgi:hypothetical protein
MKVCEKAVLAETKIVTTVEKSFIVVIYDKVKGLTLWDEQKSRKRCSATGLSSWREGRSCCLVV